MTGVSAPRCGYYLNSIATCRFLLRSGLHTGNLTRCPGNRLGTLLCFFFFSSRRRHTRFDCDWSSDVCSSDLAWVYEITPEGLKPTVEVPHGQSIRKLTGRRLDRAIIAVLVVALAYFVVDKLDRKSVV